MKLLFSWLAEFVDLKGILPQELAQRLTLSGLEVVAISPTTPLLGDKIVSGRIQQVFPHPNANKLQIAEVNIPGATLRIVCGATNIAPGDIVPVALAGAVLADGTIIQTTKIRGEESQGMLCSEKELGISPDQTQGIMQLPKNSPPGEPISKLLGPRDTVLELDITPNRADCLSHIGVARHVAAVLKRPFTLSEIKLFETQPAAHTILQVQVDPQAGCRRYCARIIQNAKIAPSPQWLQKRLEYVGFRPVNNIVDITNYVLMETGHPLHAFDRSQLSGSIIQARRAKLGEVITTIDGVEYKLSGEELVIADDKKPVALAGVMGGKSSEVTEKTREILLEAAWFEPVAVRRTSQKLNCQSESSYRFERGTDPEAGLLRALDRAAQMISEMAGGQVLQGIVEQYPLPLQLKAIMFQLNRAEKILGQPLDSTSTLDVLQRIGCHITPHTAPNTYTVIPPSHRHDISLPEDLVEEIAEIIGYDQIPAQKPMLALVCPEANPKREFYYLLRNLAVQQGLIEVINYSFMNPQHLEHLRLPPEHPWRKVLRLRNPISQETSLLRTTLLPGLIETMSYNQRRGQDRFAFFEIGAIYSPQPNQILPNEPWHLGFLLSGARLPLYWQQAKKGTNFDFFDLKGILESLAERLHMDGIYFRPEEISYLHPNYSYLVFNAKEEPLGWAGELHPECQEFFKLKHPAFMAELDMKTLQLSWVVLPSQQSFSRFPMVWRDIAFAVPENTLAGDIIQAIKSVAGEALIKVIPFDVYQSQDLKSGMKSLAFSLTFQAMDRTLKEEEVNLLQVQIIKHIEKKFEAWQR